MHQEPFCFPSSGNIPLNNAQLQFQNPYPMESPISPVWQSSFVPQNLGITPNVCNRDIIPQPCMEPPPSPLVTPVSTAMYGTTSTCSWAHKVPSLMPWIPKGEVATVAAAAADPVVRFSAPIHPDPCTSQTATSWELMHNLGAADPNRHLHLKRKPGDMHEPDTPQKVCVTEEKMAARFRDMHISNQFTLPEKSTFVPSSTTVPARNLQQLELMLDDSNSSDATTKSLILAPELKKLVEPEKILSTFLNKIEKPSMALMVWQPPNNKLLEKRDPEEKGENNNNNQQLSAMCESRVLFKNETVK